MEEQSIFVGGKSFNLTKGERYMATRFLAVKALEVFSMFVINIRTGAIAFQLDGLSFRDAQSLTRSFNTDYKGKPW